jgi:hypothetical protein
VSVIPSTSTLTAVSTGAAKPVCDRSRVAGAPVVMAALWQRLGRRCHDRLIYPSAVRIRRVLLPLALVACAAVSACGGGDDDKSDDASPSPSASSGAIEATSGPATVDLPSEACDLLSAEEVSDLVGAKVKKGAPASGPTTSGGEFSSCAYASDDPDHPADTATIVLYPNLDAADQGRGEDAQPIKGLGDQAFASTFGSVWVYVDDISVFTQWYSFDGTDQENLPKSKALAKAVVDELG